MLPFVVNEMSNRASFSCLRDHVIVLAYKPNLGIKLYLLFILGKFSIILLIINEVTVVYVLQPRFHARFKLPGF